MDLVYYTPHRLYSYNNILHNYPEQHSFSQMFNASISLIDRSASINCPPIACHVLDPLPKWTPTVSFEEICRNRYQQILDLALDSVKKLVIFYSGGIDSTLIAALAISHPNFMRDRDNILLAFSEESIKENPVFWKEHLLKSFGHRIESASGFHLLITNPENLCITGEFADNIFGSLTVKSYMDATGDLDAIHKRFSVTGQEWLLNKITNQSHRDACQHMIETILSVSPHNLKSNHDCFWWLNFVLKWQAVKFRLVSHAPQSSFINPMIQNVLHFFETIEFQNWAVMTNEIKVENDWKSYKLPAKKLIYSINQDQYYLNWKTKYPSIPGLTRYTNMYDFIYYDSITNIYHGSHDLIIVS